MPGKLKSPIWRQLAMIPIGIAAIIAVLISALFTWYWASQTIYFSLGLEAAKLMRSEAFLFPIFGFVSLTNIAMFWFSKNKRAALPKYFSEISLLLHCFWIYLVLAYLFERMARIGCFAI